jgi:hypothetical protein
MPSIAAPPAAAPDDPPPLDPQRLDCCRVALEFCVLAARLIPRGHRELRDQLTRASLSVPLNLVPPRSLISRISGGVGVVADGAVKWAGDDLATGCCAPGLSESPPVA